jgi:hypothetical protein
MKELQEEKLSTSVQTKIDCNSGDKVAVDKNGEVVVEVDFGK